MISRPRNGSHRALLQVQSADPMVLRVCDVEEVSMQGQALRIAEGSLLEASIRLPGLPVSRDVQNLSREIRRQDTMVTTVRDENALSAGVCNDLSGESQHAHTGLFRAGKEPRTFHESPSLPEDLDELSDGFLQRFPVPLSRDAPDDVPFRINEHERRPGPCAVGFPDSEIGVIDHGVGDLVAAYGPVQVLVLLFVGKLGRVHSNHDQRLGKLFFQRLQLREDVMAVNSAVGPEINEDDLPSQLPQGQRPIRVEPGPSFRKFRGVHAATFHIHAGSPSCAPLEKPFSWFDGLTTSGQALMLSVTLPFGLSPSKPVVSPVEPAERRVSQHLARKSTGLDIFSETHETGKDKGWPG